MTGSVYAWAIALLLAFSSASWLAPAGADELPNPLTIQAAIARSQAWLVAADPPRPTLYLDCDRLAIPSRETAPDAGRSWADGALGPESLARLEVVDRFFDVLLADLSFASESEAMAVAYVQYDRASSRLELGQLSELRVRELEHVYEDLLHRRVSSEVSQQLSRALLARAMGDLDQLPRDLSEPALSDIPKDLPLEDRLQEQAGASGVLAADRGSRSPEAQRRLAIEVRYQIKELLLRLRGLQAAARSAGAEAVWRDLRLDYSRTLYDQEVTADLGYSMSRQTRTRMLEKRITYCRAIAFAELRELLGEPLWTAASEQP